MDPEETSAASPGPAPTGPEPAPRPTADWRLRFTAPQIAAFTFAAAAPDRWAAVTNESGSWRAWSWDPSTGRRRQVSTLGVGAEEVHLTPDGERVVWWWDATGDERGRWMATPFAGGDPEPLAAGLPDGWVSGISLVPGAVAIGIVTDEDYRVYVGHDGEPARCLYRHERPAGVGAEWPQGRGGLSADGRLVCIRHAERGDIERQALRVLDARTGEPVAELDDGARMSPEHWSPVPGDQRLVGWSDRGGIERPFVWDPVAGTRADLDLDLPGCVFPEGWYPGAEALLLRHAHEGVDELLRYELGTGALDTVRPAGGTVSATWIRPDGAVWAQVESSVEPPRIVEVGSGREVARLDGPDRPPGRPFRPFWFTGPAGLRIQGFVVEPEGRPPFPTILSIHGGPNWHHTDAYDPTVQAYVDHGFAVALVNYRGSSGYGTAFRDALQGDIGFPESEDVNAALDHLIAEGTTDPNRVFLEGWSWGGYLAALNAGLHPQRWRAVVAGIPVGDLVAAHYESAPALQAWDVAVVGGTPMDLPELYAERNPMTYVDRVRAPVLIIAGEHDSRCPLGQVMVYAHALRLRGREVELHTYPGGHHALSIEETVRHVELVVDFFRRHLP
ncbi:MAG: peptide hydrolase [Actinomycetota bacterium]|nr:MAG: peptide hydrolase [Actinomycetota bacterium]